MNTLNRNLIESLPSELFNRTYNNEGEDNRSDGEVLYDESIPANYAQVLIPPEAFDPYADYRLSTLREATVVIKITHRNDAGKTVDKIEEFELKSEDEVQSLSDLLRTTGNSYSKIKNDNKRIFENMQPVRNNMRFLVATVGILVTIGAGFIFWCLRMKGVV